MKAFDPKRQTFEEWLLDPDVDKFPEGKYVCNEGQKAAYINAVQKLNEMALQGKCDLEAVDYRQPYESHYIEVKWKPDHTGFIEPDVEILREALKDMSLVFTEDTPAVWIISAEIYKDI